MDEDTDGAVADGESGTGILTKETAMTLLNIAFVLVAVLVTISVIILLWIVWALLTRRYEPYEDQSD